jgi:hypothetical protein
MNPDMFLMSRSSGRATSEGFEASMRYLFSGSLASLLAVSLAMAAFAQDGARPDRPAQPALNATTSPSTAPTALTGKERLGPKWTDEQRIDNCKVPIEKRGNKPRPAHCPHVPMG